MADDDKNMKKISLNDVKSKLILKKIVENILKIKLLNIIHYNKTLQTRLNIDINTYNRSHHYLILFKIIILKKIFFSKFKQK